MMRRDEVGLALLIVLWALALGSGTVLAAASAMTYWRTAAENRIALNRERWAQEACLALIQAEFEAGARTLRSDTLQVARGTWCAVEDLDPSLRINLNLADSVTLTRLLGRSAGTALFRWRVGESDGPISVAPWSPEPGPQVHGGRTTSGPGGRLLRHVRELARVPGVPDATRSSIRDLVTIRGDGRVDLNRAPAAVVRALSALSPAEADRLLRLRGAGRSFGGIEDLLLRVPMDSLAAPALAAQLRFGPAERVVRVVSGVRGPAALPVSAMTVTLRGRGDALVVLRREVE